MGIRIILNEGFQLYSHDLILDLDDLGGFILNLIDRKTVGENWSKFYVVWYKVEECAFYLLSICDIVQENIMKNWLFMSFRHSKLFAGCP